MNKDLGKKLISLVALSRKGKESLELGDFVKELAFKRKLLPAEEIEKFVNKSVENKLLIQEGDKYKSNFVVTEYTIPLDFTVDLQDLYSDRERDFLYYGRLVTSSNEALFGDIFQQSSISAGH